MAGLASENKDLPKDDCSSFSQLQMVNQNLLGEPLIPPQLTVKDFYMTGMVVLLFHDLHLLISVYMIILNDAKISYKHNKQAY